MVNFELSSEQIRLWVESKRDPKSPLLHIQYLYKFSGKLDVDWFISCANFILKKEPIFNTVFEEIDGIPRCYINYDSPSELEYIDLCDFDFLHTQAEEIAFLEQGAKKAINLLQRPNYRIQLYQSKNSEVYYFSCVLPHILIDAYSCDILFSRLAKFYNSREKLNYYPNSFYSAKQNEGVNTSSESYWRDKISSKPFSLDFHKLFTLDKGQSSNHINTACEYSDLDCSDFSKVKAIAKKLKSTPFFVLMSVYALVLYRYTGQSVFSIVYPLNIRNAKQKDTMGCYINLLPLQFDFDKNRTLESLILDITKQRKSDKPYQNYPYSNICKLSRNYGDGLFGALFSRTRLSANFALNDLEVDFILSKYGHTDYSFSILYDEVAKGCIFSLGYDSNKYPEWLAKQLLHSFIAALRNINEFSNKSMHKYPIMQVNKIVSNKSQQENNSKKILDNLINIASSDPNKLALINKDCELTYRELEDQSNKISANILALGIKPGDRVALVFETKHYYVLSIIALVKIKVTYIPIDNSTPYDRMHHILRDSDAKYLIFEDNNSDLCNDFSINKISIRALLLDPINPNITGIKDKDDYIIYILYTSGTTGKPKGIPISYRAINNLFCLSQHYFDFNCDDVWSVSHSFAFDFSVWEMWGAIYSGAKILLVPDNIKKDPQEYYSYIAKNKVTVCNITPTAFKNFYAARQKLSQKLTLRYFIFGGEKLLFSDVKPWLEQYGEDDPVLVNMYGLTEAPIHATYHKISLKDEFHGNSVIGKPLKDTNIYIVDNWGNILPEGIYGEILLSSDFMTKGYLNLPKENKKKFVANEFDAETKTIYKTGDSACWLPNGNMNYLGRTDQQVQLNGYRVELSEISYVLQQTSLVDNAVSIVYENKDNRKLIVTFCVGSTGDDAKVCIFNFLKKRLPFYMIPADIIFVDKIPLTQQGKVDVLQLKNLAKQAQSTKTPIAVPHNMIQSITNIWQEILDIKSINIDSNYFDLGGDSISLLRLHRRLEELINAEINFNDLFSNTTVRSQAKHLSNYLQAKTHNVGDENGQKKSQSANINVNEYIAIIGMAGRFPGAASLAEFWDNLLHGKESITFFSEQDLGGLTSLSGINKSYIRAKGYLEDSDFFDAEFFDYSQHDAIMLEPQHRVLLETAWSALEDAGHVSEQSGKTGVFVGQSNLGSYYYKYLSGSPLSGAGSSAYKALIQNSPDFLATRIAYKLNLTGPAMTIQTGCSTSLVAICQAAQSLLDHQCDMAIAGGVSITLPLKSGYEYEEGMIFSSDGHCRPFDENSSGTVPGNGAGVVVLKRYSDAIADKDNIYAVIKGYSMNNDGSRKIGFTAPSSVGQVEVIDAAIRNANVIPEKIDYIEAHGTATTLGDPIEIEALNRVLKQNDKNKSYKIGSVKSNIGHLDAASGVAGLIKTVLCMHHRTLVPSINYQRINPRISDLVGDVDVVTETQEWQSNNKLRLAGVSAFAVGGTNAHVVLEEHAEQPLIEINDCSDSLFILSAKSDSALLSMHHNLIKYIEESNENLRLCDLAYTLQIGRKHFNHRAYYVAHDKQLLLSKLKENSEVYAECYSEFNKICFMFPGQGVKQVRDISLLYAELPFFKEQVVACLNILLEMHSVDLTGLFDLGENKTLSSPKLFEKFNQLYIFITEYSLGRQWLAWGIKPKGMIGHSLGEYVAACLAGVWSLRDALFIVSHRQEIMNKMASGSMLAVSLGSDDIKKYLTNNLEISAINSPVRCTVSGASKDIKLLTDKLQKQAIYCKQLSVDSAYHSNFVDSIHDEFEQILTAVSFKEPNIPFVSNISGNWITDDEAKSPQYWSEHMRRSVQFSSGVDTLYQAGFSCFIELGFSNHLSSFIRQHKIEAHTYAPYCHEKVNDVVKLYIEIIGDLWLKGFTVDWNEFNKNSHGKRISLPSYPFQRKRFWVDKGVKTEGAKNTPKIYQPNWRHQPSNSLSILETEASFFVFGNGGEFAIKLIKKLKNLSNEVYDFSSIGEFREKLSKLDRANNIKVIYIYQTSKDFDLEVREKNHSYTNFENYLSILKTIAGKEYIKIEFTLVTEELFHINEKDNSNPFDSLVLGPALTASKELINFNHAIIDFNRHDLAMNLDICVKSCINEIQSNGLEKIVGFRRGKRLVRDFVTIEFPNKINWQPEENGSYVISGGLGHIGMVLAEFLSRKTKVKISLLTRRNFPKKECWPEYLSANKDTEETKIIKKLSKIMDRDSEVSIFKVDVANYSCLEKVIDCIHSLHGKINGVIHAAGVVGGHTLRELDPKSMYDIFPAKIDGLINLHKLTLDDDLDFMLLCSGLSSITGDYGQSLYNSANVFLDAFSIWRNRHHGNTVSVNWDTWIEGGMAKKIMNYLQIDGGLTDMQVQDKLADIFSFQGYNLALTNSDLKLRIEGNILDNIFKQKEVGITNNHKNNLQQDAIKQRLRGLWSQFLGCKNLTDKDDFHLIGGDSLLAVQLASMLADEYGIKIYPHVLVEHSTIEKLSHFIYKKCNEHYQTDDFFCLVELTEISKEKPNLFLIHPVGGTVNIYYDLAKCLEKVVNVYGIQAKSLDGETDPAVSVKIMAKSYIEYLKNIQPEGSYMLGGASFGGLIAYEMAQQISTKGGSIDLLFLLDTPSPENYPKQIPTDSEIIRYMLEVGAQHDVSHKFDSLSLTEQLDYFLQHAGGLGESLPQFNHEHLKRYLKIYKSNIEAMVTYNINSPNNKSQEIYYFRAAERDSINPKHPENGWKQILGEKLYIYETTGNHITMLFLPHAMQIANIVSQLVQSFEDKALDLNING